MNIEFNHRCRDIDPVWVRLETEKDYETVENLTREAFWNVYAPGCVEHYLLRQMRQSHDFIHELDFVAEWGGHIVGSVMCVRSYIEGDDNRRHEVVCLGPISVLPDYQGRGIGRILIEHVISKAAELKYRGIILCGDPLLYSRFGFEPAATYGVRMSTDRISPALQIYVLNGADTAEWSGRYIENPVYDVDTVKVELFDRRFPEKEKLVDTPTQLRYKELLKLEEEMAFNIKLVNHRND